MCLNKREVTLFYFIFMAAGVNQSFSEMSLHLHRTVALQEAHTALLRLQEHPEVSLHLSCSADRGELKHVASMELHVNCTFPL